MDRQRQADQRTMFGRMASCGVYGIRMLIFEKYNAQNREIYFPRTLERTANTSRRACGRRRRYVVVGGDLDGADAAASMPVQCS